MAYFSKTTTLLSVIITVSVLVGCGSAAKDNTTRREMEDNARLEAMYSTVAGVYLGDLYPNGDTSIPVELVISVVQVRDGIDENRELRFRTELRGVLRWRRSFSDITTVRLVGRAYPKGDRKDQFTRNDIAYVTLDSDNGQSVQSLNLKLEVKGSSLEGPYIYSGNRNTSGYAKFQLN